MAFGRIIDIRNNTTSDVLIRDLGVMIPANSDSTDIKKIRLTESASLDRINFSQDLKDLLEAGTLSVNGCNGNGDGTAATNLANLKSVDEISLTTPKLKVHYAEDDPESTTTGQSYVEKLSISFNADDADYLVQWNIEVKATYGQIGIETRVLLDGTSTIHEAHWTPDSQKVSSLTPLLAGFAPASGMQKISLTAGTHTIKLDFASSQQGKAVHARRARLSVIKM